MSSIEDGVRETLLREGIKEPQTAPELMSIYLAKRIDSDPDSKDIAGISREMRQWLEEAKNQPQRKSDAVGALIERQ